MTDMPRELAEVADAIDNMAKGGEWWSNDAGQSWTIVPLKAWATAIRTHHAEIAQNAEDLKDWEEFGRQVEKRLRHNDLGLTGGYPEMIDALLAKAKRLRALEMAMWEARRLHGQTTTGWLTQRADEIMRGES
jgi:hypothetical protein